MQLGIESPSGKWFYWVEMAGAYALCDANLAGNTVVRMTTDLSEAENWRRADKPTEVGNNAV